MVGSVEEWGTLASDGGGVCSCGEWVRAATATAAEWGSARTGA